MWMTEQFSLRAFISRRTSKLQTSFEIVWASKLWIIASGEGERWTKAVVPRRVVSACATAQRRFLLARHLANKELRYNGLHFKWTNNAAKNKNRWTLIQPMVVRDTKVTSLNGDPGKRGKARGAKKEILSETRRVGWRTSVIIGKCKVILTKTFINCHFRVVL